MRNLSFQKFFTAAVLAVCTSLAYAPTVHARMISPEDSVLRKWDGDYGTKGAQAAQAAKTTADGFSWSSLKKLAREKVNEFFGDKATAPGARLPASAEDAATKQAAQQAEDQRIVESLTESLPDATSPEARSSLKEIIQETSQQLQARDPVAVTSEGRKGTSALPNTKAGVPRFDLVKTEKKKLKNGKTKTLHIHVKDIPALDIGVEKSISKNDFVPSDKVLGFLDPVKAEPLKTPAALAKKELERWTKAKIAAVKPWTGPKDSEYGLGKIVTQHKIDKVDVNMTPEKVMEELLPVRDFDGKDYKMLMALILVERGGKCHIASGLLHDLAGVEKYKEEANFHLGICSNEMGFHSEAVTRLLRVIRSESPDYTSAAIKSLVENLPAEFETDVSAAILSVKNRALIPDEAKGSINYLHARAAYKKSQWSKVESFAKGVPESHPKYADAQYLEGIAMYAQKERSADDTLESLRKWMAKNGKQDKNLEALIAVNLGRMKFKQHRYEAAHAEYMKVPKDHPLWVEALIEQGWTQLNVDDPAGAIGNMYSLHSPYFKSVFMPESWVVRTIGYIDICQYGDAYRTLTKLEKMHAGFLHDVDGYLAQKKPSSAYYNTVRNYIKGKSNHAVDGLPAQVIREIARQRGFLNIQESINEKEDEIAQYSFISGLILKDIRELKGRRSAAAARLAKVKANLASIKKKPELAKHQNDWNAMRRAEQALIHRLAFEIYVHESSIRGYNDMRKVASHRLEKQKNELRVAAGKELRGHLRDMQSRLKQILEGNEFLRYEIFAGSGEDIRYQVAGGAVAAGRKIPANVKPQKILNWEFDGEYWEDEIGSYRSTLQNNCPNRARATASVSGIKTGKADFTKGE